MPEFKLRKTVFLLEEVSHDFGPRLTAPRRRAACLAVVANPFAGGWHAHIQPAMEDLKPLGLMMSVRLVEQEHGLSELEFGHGSSPPEPRAAAARRYGILRRGKAPRRRRTGVRGLPPHRRIPTEAHGALRSEADRGP